jgi:adenylate cyclase
VALGDLSGAGTLDGVRVGGFSVPTTATGALVLYDRPVPAEMVVSAAEVLGGDVAALRERFAGRIVLVGTSASGLLDLHATPLSPRRAGVLIHAGMIDQIVSGQYLRRADWLQGLELLGFGLAGGLLVLVVLRLGPRAGLVAALGLIAALGGGAWAAFASRGWLLDASFPIGGLLIVYGVLVYVRFARTERRRQELRRAFGHYVAPALLSRIERSAGTLALGGEVRELTVMFADMRGFTAYTEAHGAAAALGLLNTLFGALGHEIVSRDGTIDKFIGDAIMAFWNAPLDVAGHAGHAAAAALAMRARLAALNHDGTLAGLAIGVGLATGPALVGHMGLKSRFDYSAIGDSVNVASRVEAESKRLGFDIVAAETTRQAAPDLAWLDAGRASLRGRTEPLALCLLVGDATLAATPAFRALAAAHAALMAGHGDAAACAALARGVAPHLLRFYEGLPSPA